MKNIKSLAGHFIDIARVFVAVLIVLFVAMGIQQTSEAFSFKAITLKFAQLSDTHITDNADTSYKVLSNSKQLLEAAVEQLNELPDLDFVMFTGDMVNDPTKENYSDFFAILSELKYPSLMALGNHDVAPAGYPGLSRANVLSIFRKCNPNFTFDKSYYAFTPKKDFRVIVLDLTIDENESANGQISQEQLAFLDNELKANPEKIIVIFQHFPVVEPFKSESHKVFNANEYLKTVQQHKNPVLILTGHYHVTKIVRQDNIIHVTSPSLVTYPNAFRLISITNFSDRAVFDFDFKETKLVEIKEKSRLLAMTPTANLGAEKDRVTSITIMKKDTEETKAEKAETKKEAKGAKQAKEAAEKPAKIKKDKKFKNDKV